MTSAKGHRKMYTIIATLMWDRQTEKKNNNEFLEGKINQRTRKLFI